MERIAEKNRHDKRYSLFHQSVCAWDAVFEETRQHVRCREAAVPSRAPSAAAAAGQAVPLRKGKRMPYLKPEVQRAVWIAQVL